MPIDSARPLIVQKLRNATPALPFQLIRGTSNIKAVLRQSWSSPACFVWRYERKATPESLDMSVTRQSVQMLYAVLTVVALEKDDGSVEDQAEQLSDLVMRQLLGWRPYGDAPLLDAGGRALTELERNRLLWLDSYALDQCVTADTDLVQGTPQESNVDTVAYVWAVVPVAISGDRVVVVTVLGAVYADPAHEEDGELSPGITLNAAAAGDSVRIQTAGNRYSTSYTWPPGTALYLGTNGTLTPTPADTGWLWKLATVLTDNTIYFEPDTPVWRE